MRKKQVTAAALPLQIADMEIRTILDSAFAGEYMLTPVLHQHPFCELQCVIDGEYFVGFSDGSALALKKHALCLLPPGLYHRTYTETPPVRKLAVQFDYRCTRLVKDSVYRHFAPCRASLRHFAAALVSARPNIAAVLQIHSKVRHHLHKIVRIASSQTDIRPAFFDVVLQNKAVQDEDSYKVIQMLHENRCFDVAYNFTTTPAATGIFGTVVLSNGSTGFASHYDSVKDSINQAYRDIHEAVKAQ